MSSPRETLFAAVALRMESILLINGYDADVDRVYRVDVLADEMPSSVRSAILVLESLDPEDWTPLDAGPQGGYRCIVNMIIAGIARSGMTDGRSSDRHTDINYLFSSAVKAIMLDPSFGNACQDSLITRPIVYVDVDKAEGLFNLTLKCHYNFGYSDL